MPVTVLQERRVSPVFDRPHQASSGLLRHPPRSEDVASAPEDERDAPPVEEPVFARWERKAMVGEEG